jgi:hypothetical protein
MRTRKPKTIRYSAVFLLVVSSGIWLYSILKHTFLLRELGLYLALFLGPILMVLLAQWIMLHRSTWRRVVGFLLLISALGVWVISLALTLVGFKIH